MKQLFEEIKIQTSGNELIDITDEVNSIIKRSKIENGIINLNILHTSASIFIQENADPDVQKDLLNFFDKIAPMKPELYIHNNEGKDDMPAHIKTALTNTHLTISIKSKKLILGTWQGIYLFEHRISPHNRTILTHIMGE